MLSNSNRLRAAVAIAACAMAVGGCGDDAAPGGEPAAPGGDHVVKPKKRIGPGVVEPPDAGPLEPREPPMLPEPKPSPMPEIETVEPESRLSR